MFVSFYVVYVSRPLTLPTTLTKKQPGKGLFFHILQYFLFNKETDDYTNRNG